MGEEGEIPLAEESPRAGAAQPARQPLPPRPSKGQVIAPPRPGRGEEIPLADDEPAQKPTAAAPEPAATPTAGGLVLTPSGDAMVVSFQQTKILDAMEIETIGQELYALVDELACRKIAVDFSNVKFLSSQMLGVLIALQKKATAIKGRVLLCAVDTELQKIFDIVRLERVLPIMADRHTALGVLSLP